MAGFTAKHKKNNTIYTYRGELQECIEKAEEELKVKQESQEGVFLLWQYQRAKKALDSYNRRIEDLKGFIKTAKEERERAWKELQELKELRQ